MSLFNFGKKKESGCCCGGDSLNIETRDCCNTDTSVGVYNIKVLGAGCKSCHEMYENTKIALRNAGIESEVEYVTDMEKIMAYGIMSMPGLVINERVVSMGKVLKSADIEKLLRKFVL